MIVFYSKAMPSKQTVLDKINSFIDATSPKLATFLHHQINQQQNAVTYKALFEAIHQGQFPLSYLAQWQQDYSQFIIDHYAPMVDKAVKQAAIDLSGEYAGALFDPQIGLMDDYIKTHGGQLIKEVTETQYKAINNLVRQASMTDTMTVDQLARAIRPCVGLTQRQAQYVKHYYDNLIDQGYSQQAALKKQAAYAAKVHRQRAQTIAETEMAFAYNAAADAVVQQNIKDGYFDSGVQKYWLTAADERVCDECGALDGETVPIDEPFSIGVKLPPAHPRCRCAVGYKNIKVLKPAPTQATTAPQSGTQAQPDPNYTQPTIPPDLSYSEFDFSYSGSKKLGTGEMHQYSDMDGNEWLFKPAQSKGGHDKEPFRAYVQEAGYKVQNIIDPDTAVPVQVISLQTPSGKKFGAIQKRMTDLDASFDLKDWQHSGGQLDAATLSQIQKENVTDWLLCNYDSHGGNFLRSKATGKIIGVDKEQAFRYINKAEAQKMSYTFHPNSTYGETEPIYNTVYRKFAKGEIDLNLNDTLAYIKRVEAVPDAQYREIFRSYAESLHGKGPQAEHLLDQIVDRKKNLRTTFEDFYGDLLTQRKGYKTTFQFVDGSPAFTAKPMAAATLSANTLKGMSLGDLKAIAQKQGIKYAWNMNKTQLVDAISDPSKTAQIVQDAKDRAHGIGTTKKPPAPKPAAPKAQPGRDINGVHQLSDALNDIDGTLQGSTPRGVALISDSTALEGLETNLRKVTIDGADYYELSGKLAHSKWEKTINAMSGQKAGNNWHFNQVKGSIDYTKPVLNLKAQTQTYGVGTKYIRNGDDILIVTGSDAESRARALMGQFNIRVQAANGADASRKIRELMRQAGIEDIADDVTTDALERYKKMRLIWQTDPALAGKLNAATASDKDIDAALKKLGITKARLDKVEVRQVTDGYWTLYDPENIALATKHDVAYLYHEAGSIDAAANVLSSKELLATTNRWNRGITSNGASSYEDVETGGADSVFTRIVHNRDISNSESRYGYFGDYVFVFDKKTLARTDWYAYTSDKYGRTTPSVFNSRPGTEKFLEETNSSYHKSNEVLFRKALPMDTLTEVRVPSRDVKPLIDMLKQKGIKEINGIKLEDLIKPGGRKV